MLLLWANLKLSVWLDRRRRGQEETTTDQSWQENLTCTPMTLCGT
jgi:hypothetical protein